MAKLEVTDLLADLTEPQLRQLLINLSQGYPELAEAIEREIGWLQSSATSSGKTAADSLVAVDISAIRRELSKDLRNIGSSSRHDDYYYDDYYDEYFDPGEHLQPHLAKVAELLQAGDLASATAVITAVIEEWIAGISEFEDWYDFGDLLNEANHELDRVLAELILSLDLTPEEREVWQAEIADWSESVELEWPKRPSSRAGTIPHLSPFCRVTSPIKEPGKTRLPGSLTIWLTSGSIF